MTYQYDIGGNRTIREQSDINNGTIADIYQDVYLGGIERRHVQLQNLAQQAISIHAAEANIGFVNVANSRQLHFAAGAVIDYDTGDLVEWNTHYAYGADESRWKNTNEKHEDNEDPYGFTGKEEDKAVGLHYFGARYYSSYLGRWLSPDPPVVHDGGFGNHYAYCANSPYIAIDPDGNSLTALIVGAIVGAVVSATTTAIKGGSVKDILLSAVKGAVVGVATAIGGAWASAAIAMGETAYKGGSFKDVLLNGAIAYGSGWLGAKMGGIGKGWEGVGGAFGQKAISYVTGLATAYAGASLTGGLNDENWDTILRDYSVNFAVSSVASGIGGKVQKRIEAKAGMAGGEFSDEFGSESEYYGMEDVSYDPRVGEKEEYYLKLYQKHVGGTEVNQSGHGWHLWMRRTHDKDGVEYATPEARTVGRSGCSAASVTSAVLQLKGKGAAELLDTVEWMRDNDLIKSRDANPKMFQIMNKLGEHFDGVSAEYLGARGSDTVARIKDSLANGNPVVLAIKRAHGYTRTYQKTDHEGGHYVKIAGYEDGLFVVADPAGGMKDIGFMTEDQLLRGQGGGAWSISYSRE